MQLGGSRKTLGQTLSLNKIGIRIQNGARPFVGKLDMVDLFTWEFYQEVEDIFENLPYFFRSEGARSIAWNLFKNRQHISQQLLEG